MFFSEKQNGIQIAASLLHSSYGTSLLEAICPTLDFNPGSLGNLPILDVDIDKINNIFKKN